MEAMREQWPDSRLDDLNEKTGKRFEAVEGGLAEQRKETTDAYNRLDGKIEKLDEKMATGFREQRKEMTAGFNRLDGKIEKLDEKIEKQGEKIEKAIQGLHRNMLIFAGMLIVTLVGLPQIG